MLTSVLVLAQSIWMTLAVVGLKITSLTVHIMLQSAVLMATWMMLE